LTPRQPRRVRLRKKPVRNTALLNPFGKCHSRIGHRAVSGWLLRVATGTERRPAMVARLFSQPATSGSIRGANFA